MEETPTQVMEEQIESPPRWLLLVVRSIDRFSEWTGKTFAWLAIPLVAGLVYEVFARYLFHAPTVWAYDMTYMLYAAMFMLGAAYTLYMKGHIRVDFFYNNWSPRVQGTVDALLYLLFFFPGMAFFFLAGYDNARHSWLIGERSDASPWRPPLYPFKTITPVAAILLLIQGVSEFLKSTYAALKGKWL